MPWSLPTTRRVVHRCDTSEAKATVNANCLVEATAMDFLGYDGTTARRHDGTTEKTATSNISVHCSKRNGLTVALSTGGGTYANNALGFTVYGVLPNTEDNQHAPAGNYTDAITVTVIY